MSKLPKLAIKLPFAYASVGICGLEQAEHRFNYGHETFLIMVEDQVINSYEELMRLAKQNRFRDVEFLNVRLLPIVGGGGRQTHFGAWLTKKAINQSLSAKVVQRWQWLCFQGVYCIPPRVQDSRDSME